MRKQYDKAESLVGYKTCFLKGDIDERNDG